MNCSSDKVLDAMHVIWAEGEHALCTKRNGHPFKTEGFFKSYEDLFEKADTLPEDTNIWWNVHGMLAPKSGRGGVEDVTQVSTISADFDWLDENAHKGSELPSEEIVRTLVKAMEPQPTVIINSGHGLQLYWVLDAPLDRAAGGWLIDGFFRYIEAEYGLKNDRIDLASILRLPGSINNKSDCEPIEVTVEQSNDWAYDANWLLQNCWLDMKEPEVITPPVPAKIVVQGLRQVGGIAGQKPSEWMNQQRIIPQTLTEGGWTEMKNDEWCRPGKNPRDGASATYHPEKNVLVIWSTEAPREFLNLGTPAKGGTGTSCTPSDIYAAVHFDGDLKAAWRYIGQNLMPKTESMPTARIDTDSPTGKAEDSEKPSTDLNLAPEFWESRDYLTKIRDAAWSRSMSPDAVLGAVLARYAALIPRAFRIPAVIGSLGTFDHLSVICAKSAVGKSASMSIARELVPDRFLQSHKWDRGVPSGEGLIEAFLDYKNVTDDEGNTKKEKGRVFDSVHWTVDEGRQLVAVTGRDGATISSVLCTAWSGGPLGQENASVERRRHIPAGEARVTGIVGIQSAFGHELLTDSLIGQGFSGRILFHWADDPNRPRGRGNKPAFPGQLNLHVHDSSPLLLTYDEAILLQVEDEYDGRVDGEFDPIDGHLNLVRLKVAGMFALMEGRLSVTIPDWDLAESVVISSIAVRNHLINLGRAKIQAENVTKATTAGHYEAIKSESKERRAIADMRDKIIDRIPPEGIGRGKLRVKVTSSKYQDRFNQALTAAQDDGKVEKRDKRFFLQ